MGQVFEAAIDLGQGFEGGDIGDQPSTRSQAGPGHLKKSNDLMGNPADKNGFGIG